MAVPAVSEMTSSTLARSSASTAPTAAVKRRKWRRELPSRFLSRSMTMASPLLAGVGCAEQGGDRELLADIDAAGGLHEAVADGDVRGRGRLADEAADPVGGALVLVVE